jgi:mono/diheme cytochrome c family protein
MPPPFLSVSTIHGKLFAMMTSEFRRSRFVRIGLAALVVVGTTLAVSARFTPRQASSPPSKPAQNPAAPATKPGTTRVAGDVARGEYLANNVAMCVQCHSPRDQHGHLIENQKFTGASMPVRGPSWDSDWAYRTPALAGLPGFTDEQIVMLLTEGPAGDRPAPMRPMPPFRMNKQDAEAVAAYLRSR